MKTRSFFFLCAALALSSTASATPIAIEYNGIVAPGTGGQIFKQFSPPVIAANFNSVLLYASYGANTVNQLFQFQNGTLSETAVNSELFTLNTQGQAAIYTGPNLDIQTQSGLVTVASVGVAVPGTSSKLNTIFGFNYSSDGAVSYLGQTADGTLGYSRATASGATLVALGGETLPSGQIVYCGTGGTPVVGNGATTTFHGSVSPGALDAIVRQTVSGAPQIVVLQGQQAPGLPTGVDYGVVKKIVENDAGQLAYHERVSSGSDDIFRDLGSGPKFAVGYGSSVPNAPGDSLTGLDDPTISENGTIGFSGLLYLGGAGIWTEDPSGVIHELALQGANVPGIAVQNMMLI